MTREEISNTYGISLSCIKHRIDGLKLVSNIKKKNNFLYNENQVKSIISLGKEIRQVVEIIKVTETYIYIPSAMNYTNFE